MSQDITPTRPSTPPRSATAEKQALLEAYDSVLRQQAERREAETREAEARRGARQRTRPVVWTSVALTLVLCSYLFIERPAWIFPQAGPVESAEVQEASIRIGMATAAQHVQRFRQRENRYPETLSEAGAYGEGIEYTRIGDGWRMTSTWGTTEITLDSQDPLPVFLGKSFEIIARRAP